MMYYCSQSPSPPPHSSYVPRRIPYHVAYPLNSYYYRNAPNNPLGPDFIDTSHMPGHFNNHIRKSHDETWLEPDEHQGIPHNTLGPIAELEASTPRSRPFHTHSLDSPESPRVFISSPLSTSGSASPASTTAPLPICEFWGSSPPRATERAKPNVPRVVSTLDSNKNTQNSIPKAIIKLNHLANQTQAILQDLNQMLGSLSSIDAQSQDEQSTLTNHSSPISQSHTLIHQTPRSREEFISMIERSYCWLAPYTDVLDRDADYSVPALKKGENYCRVGRPIGKCPLLAKDGDDLRNGLCSRHRREEFLEQLSQGRGHWDKWRCDTLRAAQVEMGLGKR